MKYYLYYYLTAFALGIITLLAQTKWSASHHLELHQASTGEHTWAQEHISISPAPFTRCIHVAARSRKLVCWTFFLCKYSCDIVLKH